MWHLPRIRAALRPIVAVALACAVLPAALGSAGSTTSSSRLHRSGPAVDLLFDRTLELLLDDASNPDSLNGFWATTLRKEGVSLPAPDGQNFTGGSGTCASGGHEAEGDAQYCPDDHSILYDREWLGALERAYGSGAVAAVLAHAWGHVVQATTATPVGPMRAELQADCYAGMYLGHLVRSGRLSTFDVTRAHRSSYLLPEDPAGPPSAPAWIDPTVHGSWTARRQALGVGYDTGQLAYCRGYDGWSDVPPIELGAFETLTPGPVLSANVDARGALELRYPDALVRVSQIDRQASPPDAGRGDLLRQCSETGPGHDHASR